MSFASMSEGKRLVKTLLNKVKILKENNDNLKCCGNCSNFMSNQMCVNEPDKYCDSWEYDGLTREDREV